VGPPTGATGPERLRRQRRSSRGAYVKLASACSESSAFKCPVARLARTQTQAQILALSYASSPPGANNGRGTRGELKGCRANRLGLVRTALASACSESSAFKCPVARLARTQTQAQILALSYASSPPGANNGRGTRGELKGCRANRLGLVRTALAARAAKTLSVGQLRLCAERLVETLWAPHLRCARSPCARPHLRPSAGALLLRAPTRTSP
jgi:hypothetical protein